MKNLAKIIILSLPTSVFAQGPTFATLTNSWVNFLNKVVGVLGSLAFLFFMWGGAMTILGSGDATKVAEGKKRMVWSFVALLVMFSVWGLLAFMDSSLFGNSGEGPAVGPGGITGPDPGAVPSGRGPL